MFILFFLLFHINIKFGKKCSIKICLKFRYIRKKKTAEHLTHNINNISKKLLNLKIYKHFVII